MKTIRRILLLLLAVGLVLAVVVYFREPKTPEEYFLAASKKMGTVSSMRFEMRMDMDGAILMKPFAVDLSMEGEMTADPAMVHGTMKMGTGDSALTESELYMETEGNESVTYIGTQVGGETQWISQRDTADSKLGTDVQSGTIKLLELVNFLSDTEPEQISATELAFRGVIPSDKVQLAFQIINILTQLRNAEWIDFDGLDEIAADLEDMPVVITVDTEELVITGYELDMTGVMQEILRTSVEKSMDRLGLALPEDELIEVGQVTAKIRLYDYDAVEEIRIPVGVR